MNNDDKIENIIIMLHGSNNSNQMFIVPKNINLYFNTYSNLFSYLS